ncbi:TPA: UDP-N-acetylmuramyl-tripeptide synthetase [Candidatus Wolfebacteria bacterium]|nr:MAG: UDP-N-acetylmuramyl-tripeptide synthetase [Candidatus Wolfebacteria bacterium GW2011_GWB2_46_69]KKU53268.1 MAG: UDP-N-acetylmuramyl-tripeptide synthetase [Candidatus Wolfebacteria bacterium GW2011_GWC1_47_103]KKU59111.1 MAG: UDP-N-acetylmuramyl-tripeptide synthetase [Candidatus Wolfebacteria bacterium GW2011_GWE2_47_12]KKU65686.1 MAG: UDP-N-acetylmuramyl-tripeptide synthetase [Candidatus Wolfebacteria bacterium GW2011_GWD2_47_17]HAL24481.1 hypothetical protein [Candidatus Wolfebacteria 
MTMEKILRIGRKIIPQPIFEFFQPVYHYLLALTGAVIYGFPSKGMIVIGVTGTKGKTTTSNLIAHVLNESGHKTGLATTVNFRIGEKEWMNEYKQTMVGRFRLQRLLWQMKKAGCEYAVVETSSEGILQYRHRFIDYDVAVFTNLSPEHIERHKGFENYREAKVKLFKKLSRKKKGIGVYNLDDEHVKHFLDVPQFMQYGYTLSHDRAHEYRDLRHIVEIKNVKLQAAGSEFDVKDAHYTLPLIGEFNVQNAGAAICVALSQGIEMGVIGRVLANMRTVPGRMEVINKGQNFSVIVDYAYEPKSLEAVYSAIIGLGLKKEGSRMICLFGGTGGGRDIWRRPVMGKIAASYCDEIMLTNDDPYDDDQMQIINEIKQGISEESFDHAHVHVMLDRREAIKKAFAMAKEGDTVVLTGKGGELVMCMEDGKKIPWDEKKVVEEELEQLN